jgi:GntR family transcriptional regulator, transcriptional repressor for pyruvate dehydrogenase complex
MKVARNGEHSGPPDVGGESPNLLLYGYRSGWLELAVNPTTRDVALSQADLRVPKAAELVAAKIRRQIVRGELPEGTALPPEAELVARYNVSRPTLREAFRILESELLIVVRRGVKGGALVHTPSIDVAARSAQALLQYRGTTLADVHQARIMLEPQAVAILAEHRDPDALAALVEAHDQEVAAQSDAEIRQTGGRFHRVVVERSENHTLSLLSAMVQRIIDLQTARKQALEAMGVVQPRHRPEGHADHGRLIELVRAGAANEAERFWREHLERVKDWLLGETDAETVLELVE